MTNCSAIMAIIQDNRLETAAKVQDVLTRYGCHIRVRLGLHESKVGQCVNTGIILLQLCGEDKSVPSILESELKKIANVKVKYMTLD